MPDTPGFRKMISHLSLPAAKGFSMASSGFSAVPNPLGCSSILRAGRMQIKGNQIIGDRSGQDIIPRRGRYHSFISLFLCFITMIFPLYEIFSLHFHA